MKTNLRMLLIALQGFLIGAILMELKLFPYNLIQNAKPAVLEIKRILTGELPWYYRHSTRSEQVDVIDRQAIQPGLSLITGIGPNNHSQASVIDVDGNVIHNWQINWFELWPDATHIPESKAPTREPEVFTHGVVLMDNGDLVFSLSESGLFRMDLCGNLVWKFPRMTHHALVQDEQGYLWTLGQDYQFELLVDLPGYIPDFEDFKIFKMTPEGELVSEWRLFDILKDNHLESLLYMSNNRPFYVDVTGDTLHINDIDIFPSTMESGAFEAGDIMISLRNIHTVLVLDQDMQVKHQFTGSFIRQHDPDFIDGNRILVFDNYTHTAYSPMPYSRILELEAGVNEPIIRYQGTQDEPFFTAIMGKHQILDNGNILVTEAVEGRAFELSEGRIVWQYFNLLPNDLTGFIDEAQRLPAKFDRAFFEENRQKCIRL